MKKFLALAAAASLVGAAPLASAASFTLTPTVVAAFQPGTFDPIPGTPDTQTLDGNDRVFQIDYNIGVSDLQPGERGFGSTGFNIILSPGLIEGGAGGWAANISTTDSNGLAPGGIVPLYSTNADVGPSNSDLLGIFATIAGGISAPNASDGRVKIGQPGGDPYVGSVFVQWTADVTSVLSSELPEFVVYLDSGQFGPTTIGQGGTLLFGIPEPSTIALGGMGLLGLVAVRRRRMA